MSSPPLSDPNPFGMSSAGPRYKGEPDVFELQQWYDEYRKCVRFFVEFSQHTRAVQAVSAFLNIRLPFQETAALSAVAAAAAAAAATAAVATAAATATGNHQHPNHHGDVFGNQPGQPYASRNPLCPPPLPGAAPVPPAAVDAVSLLPYVRRMVAMGCAQPAILDDWFGPARASGVTRIFDAERNNYLFACKSASWMEVKASYDLPGGQNIPYLRPLGSVTEAEILAAEEDWSDWLAMQDWMLGPRAPSVDAVMSPPPEEALPLQFPVALQPRRHVMVPRQQPYPTASQQQQFSTSPPPFPTSSQQYQTSSQQQFPTSSQQYRTASQQQFPTSLQQYPASPQQQQSFPMPSITHALAVAPITYEVPPLPHASYTIPLQMDAEMAPPQEAAGMGSLPEGDGMSSIK